MRALFRSSWRCPTEAEIDRDVQVRLFRQRRLTHDPALTLFAIIDESALRRAVGGTDVMRAQLLLRHRGRACPDRCSALPAGRSDTLMIPARVACPRRPDSVETPPSSPRTMVPAPHPTPPRNPQQDHITKYYCRTRPRRFSRLRFLSS